MEMRNIFSSNLLDRLCSPLDCKIVKSSRMSYPDQSFYPSFGSLLTSEMLFFFDFAEIGSPGFKSDPFCQTFKLMTSLLCSYIAQMGDNYLVLQMIEKVMIDQIVSWLNCASCFELSFAFTWGFVFLCYFSGASYCSFRDCLEAWILILVFVTDAKASSG